MREVVAGGSQADAEQARALAQAQACAGKPWKNESSSRMVILG